MPPTVLKFRTTDELVAANATTDEFRSEHAAVLARMDYLLRSATSAERDLTADEKREYDALAATAIGIHDHIQADAAFMAAQRAGVVSARDVMGPPGGEYREGKPLAADQTLTGYIKARNLIREDEEDLSLQKYLRGIATGDWTDATRELRAMSEGVASSGGYLLPTILSAQIIDMVRNQTRVMQAGATVVPMENRTLDVAKWTGDPTAAWHTENAAIAPSDPTLGKLTLTAQALASNVEVSWELLEDAPGVEQKLIEAFAKVFALKLDLAALYGTGTAPEPRGVKNTVGINTASMGANGAAITDFDTLIDAVGRLQDDNEEPTGIIYAGRTARVIAKFKDTSNQPLQTPEFLAEIPRFVTAQVPTNLTVGSSSVTSDIFTADWRQLLIGVRTQLRINVLKERYADSGQTGFVAWWRGDTQVARPSAFDVVTGVL